MVHQMNDIDSCFTKEFLEKQIRQANGGKIVPGDKRLKATAVNQLLVLQAMTCESKGLEKVKTDFEDSLQVIHEQVRKTEAA